eukprot:gene40806-50170_t
MESTPDINNDHLLATETPNTTNEQPSSSIVEQDTIDSEDIEDLLSFISPPSTILQSASNVGIQYSRSVFEGWGKQPTARCGASSLAGAWDAPFRWPRKHPKAVKHQKILA